MAKNYYNPGNFLRDILVLAPSPSVGVGPDLQRAFGQARVTILAGPLPRSFGLVFSFGFQPQLLGLWFFSHLQKILAFEPQFIRSYGHGFALSLGTYLKKKLKVPLICSLHGDPDRDYNRGRLGQKNPFRQVVGFFQGVAERQCWPFVDHAWGVYDSLLPFLRRMVRNRYSIQRHMVDQGKVKKDYRIRNGAKILYVGRIDRMEKDPTAILLAVAKNPAWQLDIIGNGNNLERVRRLVAERNLGSRVTIRSFLPNRKLINTLHRYDWMAGHSLHEGVSKIWIEAAMVGLPLVLNRQPKRNNREFWSLPALRVEDNPSGYFQAFQKLSQSITMRKQQGRRARAHVQKTYSKTDGIRSIRSLIQSLTSRSSPCS